jgi:hypothetical protein
MERGTPHIADLFIEFFCLIFRFFVTIFRNGISHLNTILKWRLKNSKRKKSEAWTPAFAGATGLRKIKILIPAGVL